MTYTGTGTQEAPYLVDNFEDFLTCVGEPGAYVKVIADIDASLEEKYQSSTGRINIQAAEIYSDKTTEISNMIVLGSSCFYKPEGGNSISTIRNIHFKNIVFKINGNTGNIFSAGSTDYLEFHDCQISAQAVCGRMSLCVGARAKMHRCAVIVECLREGYPDSTTYISQMFDSSFVADDSIFEIIDWPLSNSIVASSVFSGVFTYCTLKLSIRSPKKLVNSSYSVFGDGSHDNVLILAISHDDGNATKERFTVKSTMTAIDTESSTGADISRYYTSTVIFQLTTAQIKSETYLREIGFIP